MCHFFVAVIGFTIVGTLLALKKYNYNYKIVQTQGLTITRSQIIVSLRNMAKLRHNLKKHTRQQLRESSSKTKLKIKMKTYKGAPIYIYKCVCLQTMAIITIVDLVVVVATAAIF